MKYKKNEMVFREIKPNLFVAEFPNKSSRYNDDFSAFGEHKTHAVKISLLNPITIIYPDVFFVDKDVPYFDNGIMTFREYYYPFADIITLDGETHEVETFRYSENKDVDFMFKFLKALGYRVYCGKIRCMKVHDDLTFWFPVYGYGYNNTLAVEVSVRKCIEESRQDVLKEVIKLYAKPMAIDFAKDSYVPYAHFTYADGYKVWLYYPGYRIKALHDLKDYLDFTLDGKASNTIKDVVPTMCDFIEDVLNRMHKKYKKGVFKELRRQAGFTRKRLDYKKYEAALVAFMSHLLEISYVIR